MSTTILALPVSLEQIAAVVKQMSAEDQKRLLELVPSLKEVASQSTARTTEETQTNITHLRTELLAQLNNQPLASDEPFLGDLTLAQYHALSEEEKAQLWEQLTEVDISAL